MDDHREAGGPVPGGTYALCIRRSGGHAEVVLFDAMNYAAGRYEEVWCHRFEDFGSANRLFLAMLPYPVRWASWARMVSIMGTAFVHGLIAAEAGLARRTEQQRLRDRKRRDDLKRHRDEAARRTWLWLVPHGAGPRIVASCGDDHVIIMKLETIDEALRVWDWMRWQRRSVDEWLLILDQKGSEVLQSVILRRMVADERRFKASGRKYQSGRPLRHWRPGAEEDEQGHP